MPVLLPESLLAACDLVAEYSEGALPVAGATDLFRGWLTRPALHQRALVDLSQLQELRPLGWNDRELVIGALVPFAETAADPTVRRELPALAAASAAVAPLQVRLRATWGGNVVSGHGDGTAVLVAAGARAETISRDGSRTVEVEALLAHGLRPGELLRRLRVSREAAAAAVYATTSASGDWRRRTAVAAAPAADGWRVAVSLGGTVRRAPAVEAALAAGERGVADLGAAFRSDVDDGTSRALARLLAGALAAT